MLCLNIWLFLNGLFVVVSSIFQGGVCGLAGKFPIGYVNAVISGQALGGSKYKIMQFKIQLLQKHSTNARIKIYFIGGIFASLANIVSIAVGASPTQSAFLYFMAADFTLVLSFCLYMALSSTVSKLCCLFFDGFCNSFLKFSQ